jgi:phage tail-like protein
MALPFAHLCGRPMWERCDHEGTRIDAEPVGVRLAPRPEATGPAGGASDNGAAWERRRGSAVAIPCGPEACEQQQVLLLDPEAGLLLLDGPGWLPLTPGTTPGAAAAEPAMQPPVAPGEPQRFLPPLAPTPEQPAGLALDPWGGLWLLDRPGRALRRLGPAGQVVASVALPLGWEPLRFGCTALGLAIAVVDRRGLDRAGPDRGGPALLFRPWQGEWRGLQLPPPASEPSPSAATAAPAPAAPAAAAPATVALIDLAADPTISWMAALIRLDRADQDPAHRLVIWDGRRWRNWLAPTLTRPRHLLIDGAESVLVSEPLWGPGDSRPTPFTRLLIRPTGLEAEQSYSVRGFDGRGLWREGDTVFASTASGARALLRRERPLHREGRVETWALDSGSFACHWHRLFVDVCLPPGTRLWVEGRSADDLPPWEVRRGARPPQDLAGDKPPPPPAPPLSDPWPPLASRSADDQEGWQLLSVPDRRPALADQPLERPAEGYGEMETLEWLVSTPPGRYLWLRLHLEGDGRRSPVVYALRVSQPRPPMLERLPAFWRADPEAGERSERLLALFEGPLTELEHRSESLLRLFLPALTPAEALPWLAGFLALTYHDQVPEPVRRQLLAEIASLYRQRGTRPGLERLLSILAEAPVVIVEAFRLRRRTAALLGESSVLGPALELGGREAALGLDPLAIDPVAIGASGDEEERMALAHGALLATRASERSAGRSPCPSTDPPSPLATDPLRRWFRQRAHRFTVLVPRCRTAALEVVLEQALQAHKPAHTLHQFCWIEAGYCLAQGVRVGLHRLGPSSRASPPVLGQALLGGGTDPLPGGLDPDSCGPGVAVLPFLPMRSRQP